MLVLLILIGSWLDMGYTRTTLWSLLVASTARYGHLNFESWATQCQWKGKWASSLFHFCDVNAVEGMQRVASCFRADKQGIHGRDTLCPCYKLTVRIPFLARKPSIIGHDAQKWAGLIEEHGVATITCYLNHIECDWFQRFWHCATRRLPDFAPVPKFRAPLQDELLAVLPKV